MTPPALQPSAKSQPPAAEPALRISGLSFGYAGQPPIFDDFALEVGEGSRFGLFGPNGAGKTTLIQLITGLLTPSRGDIHLFGQPVVRGDRRVNRLFGFIPQDLSFYEELSPVENLAFFGAWSGLDGATIRRRTDELLGILGLADVRDKKVAYFSGGMKRRVNLAIGVIHRPRLLFLDEPTVGVDVQTRAAIISYLKDLNNEGMTLIYTSHQLGEAESLCNRVALIDKGHIVAQDTLDALLAAHQSHGLEGLFLQLTGKAYRDIDV
ncbi:MAG TPA: ABC transporter ATP-binding protein [Puia sp.]|nr:ABC transporter ATP-binding protein [Puia sp.]